MQSASRMNTQPWVIASGLSGLPVELWLRFMPMWADWSAVVAEGEAGAQELRNEQGR